MSTYTAVPSGTIGPFDLSDWRKLLGRSGPSTSLNKTTVTPEVADVITAWEEGDISNAPVASYPATEVEAVEFIRDVLRLPVISVLGAVGIAEKSFYNWRKSVERPRVASTGTLWPMTQVLFQLRQSRPDFVGWFHSNTEAQRRFAEGDVNGLALEEFTSAVRSYPSQIRSVPDFDRDDAGPYEGPATRERRVSQQVPPALRRKDPGADGR